MSVDSGPPEDSGAKSMEVRVGEVRGSIDQMLERAGSMTDDYSHTFELDQDREVSVVPDHQGFGGSVTYTSAADRGLSIRANKTNEGAYGLEVDGAGHRTYEIGENEVVETGRVKDAKGEWVDTRRTLRPKAMGRIERHVDLVSTGLEEARTV